MLRQLHAAAPAAGHARALKLIPEIDKRAMRLAAHTGASGHAEQAARLDGKLKELDGLAIPAAGRPSPEGAAPGGDDAAAP